MNPIHSFDDVLRELDAIIEHAASRNSNLAYFAFLYRRTTAEIKARAEAGVFQDFDRIQRFDIEFAKMYIEAYWDFQQGKPVSESAKVPFTTSKENLLILQHLVLGMNVHINLDLGNAAALIAPNDQIQSLEADFNLVNQILQDLVGEMETRLSKVSFLMFLLRWAGGRTDDVIIGWSIKKAREKAWKFALKLAPLTGTPRESAWKEKDLQIAQLAQMVAHPPGRFLRVVLWLIRLSEVKNVRKAIGLLGKG